MQIPRFAEATGGGSGSGTGSGGGESVSGGTSDDQGRVGDTQQAMATLNSDIQPEVSHNEPLVGASLSEELFQPPIRAEGRYIRDASGKRFKLCSVNWYGGSDELFVPSGLDQQPMAAIARLIRSMGFNSVRLPYSDEMVMSNPEIQAPLLSANPELIGMRALDIFTACVNALTDAGLAVIVNDHITAARWCDGKNLCDAAWKNDHLKLPGTNYSPCRVKLTENQWIENWVTIMKPFRGNGRVIGCDLRNEVRGIWGTMNWDMWATAAERCSERLLSVDDRWLMFVEGIGSANDCSGARTRPVQLSVPGRLVYSVHVYAWSGWGSMDPYSRRPYAGFAMAMHRNWAFLLTGNEAPVWVGELGAGPAPPSRGDAHYWNSLMRFLADLDVDFAYWAINPRKPHGNERETWALTDDSWTSTITDYRMLGMQRLMKPLGYEQTRDERLASGQRVD